MDHSLASVITGSRIDASFRHDGIVDDALFADFMLHAGEVAALVSVDFKLSRRRAHDRFSFRQASIASAHARASFSLGLKSREATPAF